MSRPLSCTVAHVLSFTDSSALRELENDWSSTLHVKEQWTQREALHRRVSPLPARLLFGYQIRRVFAECLLLQLQTKLTDNHLCSLPIHNTRLHLSALHKHTSACGQTDARCHPHPLTKSCVGSWALLLCPVCCVCTVRVFSKVILKRVAL